ncbi:hypothetical protein LUZ63_011974 [Rhynchospora breviuscula]|uniref:Uncharacterized protein n=1 Tax=Rhynchospora breviuscula TaxID=2022672 RepID=A0A9Q0HQY7_9POAL|nr:hypothetical protein LUZ63_011974 [Rhynchospora breviuscula]
MAKYNVVMRWKREKAQERKRAIHGDPKTKKLKELSKHTSSLSGKRKQKLMRKLRREQKDAVEKGLVTMADVEMACAEETSSKGGKQMKLQIKKSSKLQIKRLRDKARRKERKSKAPAQETVDSMVE